MIVNITKIDGKNITLFDKTKPKGEEEITLEREEWVKPEFVKLGEAEVTIKDGKISFVAMVADQAKADQKSKESDKKWEDEMVTFETLLTKAHDLKEKFSIKTERLELDLEKKFALFKAQVIIRTDGQDDYPRIFEGHGDATKDNVKGEHIKPHFIRLAETRSIVRALRWYTNNGVAEEEKK